LRETRARAEVSGVNIDIVPLGERAQRSMLDHVLAVGDEAETNYLEAKSALDLTSAEGVAKIAKFLLGAANRRPKRLRGTSTAMPCWLSARRRVTRTA